MSSSLLRHGLLENGLAEKMLLTLRGVVARRGEDARLVRGVSLLPGSKAAEAVVSLSDGREGRWPVTVEQAAAGRFYGPDGLMGPFAAACGQAFGVVAPASGGDGLASDGWWHGAKHEDAVAARHWARVLLNGPDLSDLVMDRFIASLDPPKREELMRRAKYGEGVAGF